MSNFTETKLNNFPEIDCFVVISCYKNSLFDLKKFFKLLITPFELEIALTGEGFNNYFLVDGLNLV
jgi:diphthamide biosynthesis protein 2